MGYSFHFFFVLMILMLGSSGLYTFAEGAQSTELDRLLPLVGGALVEAGQGKWKEAAAHIDDASAKWKQLEPAATKESAAVDSALAGAIKALAAPESDADAAKATLSLLAKALNKYVKSVQDAPGDSTNWSRCGCQHTSFGREAACKHSSRRLGQGICWIS